MKTLLLFLCLLLCGCYTLDQVDLFTGSWVATHPTSTSMLFLHEDSTCSMYKKVGSPNAGYWEGYWRAERNTLFILDQSYTPVAAASLSGRMRMKIFFDNELYYFHKYGSFPGNGGL